MLFLMLTNRMQLLSFIIVFQPSVLDIKTGQKHLLADKNLFRKQVVCGRPDRYQQYW